ncbi:hypothetical protein [Rhizobium phaseoli]|uniref:hypothetical protein n=1 Tax=Rhizobium phaseoli TaxID=396 RepID=UPI000BE7E122|nr:hypothetical protein [Rhizobium phaseoli]PDS69879.1 hypothetical protein CO651_21950 [Rhizobium phaseoli]
MLNDPWASLVASIRRRRAPDARFFKPVCLIAAIDLTNDGQLDAARLDAEVIILRFKAYVSLVFEGRAEMGWKPLWHLSNDGLWTFYADGVALGPDDFGADRKPGTKSILFNRFDELSIDQRYRDTWQDESQRMALRHAMLNILANDDEGCRQFARQLFHADRAMQPHLWPSEEQVIGELRLSKSQLDLFDEGVGVEVHDGFDDADSQEFDDLDDADFDLSDRNLPSPLRTPSVTEIGEVASPTAKLNSASEIDLDKNPHIDSSDDASNLEDFSEIQIVQITVILGSLPGNAPKGLALALIAYKTELEKRGARPIIGILTNQHAIIDAEYRTSDASDWLPPGMKEAGFRDFFRYHHLFLQHFPFMSEREKVISRINVDETKATGEELIRPFRAAVEMAKAAQNAGVATTDVVQFMQELKQGAESLAGLPNDVPILDVSNEDRLVSAAATPKQRLIGTAIGFLERAYNLLGATVGIGTATYPAFAQNLNAVLDMLKSLMRNS